MGDLFPLLAPTSDGDPDAPRSCREAEAGRAWPRGVAVTVAAGCSCSRHRRNWDHATGVCRRCGSTVREVQIMDAVKAVLVADSKCVLWRNEIGSSTHWPTGEARKGPIRYGVANPGGSDLIGLYGARFLAIECKTVRGQQSAWQVAFERCITARGGIYALVRSEPQAADLLAWLQAGSIGALPAGLAGGGAAQ